MRSDKTFDQHRTWLGSPWVALGLVTLVAVATRWFTYANPVANPDEQFYLLVGDAMRHGAWPYIDIWDRKPYGLFALFWAMAVIGNGSPLVVKLIATGFAIATAMVVRRIAGLFAPAPGATLSAVVYVLMLPLFGGQWAQAPVFFNLFMALAAWMLLQSTDAAPSAIRRHALWAMLCCGLALSIKQVSVVEGVFIGCAFLWLLWRAQVGVAKLAGTAVAMVAIALLPTAASIAAYALRGRRALDDYVYANFISIFDKTSFGSDALSAGILYFLLFMGPLLVLALIGLAMLKRREGDSTRTALLAGWIVAAFGSYLIVPYFFDQYALPLVAPLCVAAAAVLARPTGLAIAAAVGLLTLIVAPGMGKAENEETARTYAAISDLVDRSRQGGCLLVNDGPTWLYQSTGACALTRYIFPGHLNLVTEINAVGTDTKVETLRVLAQRPAVIVTQTNYFKRHNPVTRAIVQGTLARDYRMVGTFRSDRSTMVDTVTVWQRRDLPPPEAAR